MEDDQQFCLRWNNHQSTLISVFDTLLEKGVHVDCTLAAEGRTLNAHKVVLSACSPYFEAVLGQQYDKHPIIILKDVKFAELRAMMDYMYRGEVNISQDQLGALLKAAESLQIKGLSDNKPPPPPPPPLARSESLEPAPVEADLPPKAARPKPRPADEDRSSSPRPDGRGSREGSESPARRKRKRRRPSLSPADSRPRYPTPPAAAADCFDAPETEPENDIPPSPGPIEPKAEFVEGNEDSVEDLTVDEEMDSDGEQPGASRPSDGSDRGCAWQTDRSRDDPGVARDGPRDSQGVASLETGPIVTRPSDGITADDSDSNPPATAKSKLFQGALSQNNNVIVKGDEGEIAPVQKREPESEDEYYDFDDILLPDESEVYGALSYSGGEEEAGAARASRRGVAAGDEPPPQFVCRHCGKRYRWKSTLRRHESVECGGKPPTQACPYCPYRAKQRGNLGVHVRKHHNQQWNSFADTKLRKTKKENQSVKY